MSLAEQLWCVWDRLREAWSPYFAAAAPDLDLTGGPKELLSRLKRPVAIDRSLPGLEEFAADADCGIQASDPARSLFYHVLASPHVVPYGIAESDYPTILDLGIIENCIYAAADLTLDKLLRGAERFPLAVGVFAYEYAPASDTVHRRHADMCFSRTGIARVGNAIPHYIAKARGFFPDSGAQKTVHAIPARYGAFLAAQLPADPKTFGPLGSSRADEGRQFWFPLHKLFPGEECIRGIDVQLDFDAHHVNEKIKRVHAALQAEGVDTGWNAWQMQAFPFVIEKDLAEFCAATGLLTPVPHTPMIEPAKTEGGKLVGFKVPKHTTLFSSLWFPDNVDARSSPEFVHAKHAIMPDGEGRERVEYLPDMRAEDIDQVVAAGGYEAANFIDWTADGWIHVSCPPLAKHIHKRLSAYSVLAQPDFFPLVKQQDLARWWKHTVREDLREFIWPDREIVPTSMAGARLPANMTLRKADFDSADDTMTAIVGPNREPGPAGTVNKKPVKRESTLSYRATNLFEPGWDTSKDFGRDSRSKQGTFFLANYGLGSPFAEDTLICAAFGAFWPGAVPDVTRFFAPHTYPSSTPFTDGHAGWDGLALPEIGDGVVTYGSFGYADYVEAIWKDALRYETFARIEFDDYADRTLSMARVFQYLGIQGPADRAKIAVLSFRAPTDAEFCSLSAAGWPSPVYRTYRFELARFKGGAQPGGNPRDVKLELDSCWLLFASPDAVAAADPENQGNWIVAQF